jgi:hypothetical protein
MTSRLRKIALTGGGVLPTVGAVVAALFAHPWWPVAILGFGALLTLTCCWVVFRQPFFEVRETFNEGSRHRPWRAGVGGSPGTRPALPSLSCGHVHDQGGSADHWPALQPEDPGS